MISVIGALTTSIAFSVPQRKASTQCVNVSPQTKRYLYPLALGMCVKSSCQSSPGYYSVFISLWVPGDVLGIVPIADFTRSEDVFNRFFFLMFLPMNDC